MKKITNVSNYAGSEVAWRNLVSAVRDLMLDVGMVQVEDVPGQMDPDTHPHGTIGFFMFRMNDAMQSSLPVYVRLQAGNVLTSGNGLGKFNWVVQVGTSYDAEDGTIEDPITTGSAGYVLSSGSQVGTIGAVHTDGFFCIFGSFGQNSGPSVAVCRTCDSEGVATDFGLTTFRAASSTSTNIRETWIANYKAGPPPVRAFPEANVSFETALLKPMGIGNSISGELPAYLAWHALPEIMPMHGVCGVLAASMTQFDTFNVAIVGNTPRPYLVLGNQVFDQLSGTSYPPTTATMAILWE